MSTLSVTVLTQAITFLPLAIGISISYTILRATDMTLDGSFVLGAAIFAKLVSSGVLPFIAILVALVGGMLAGVMVSVIQRGGKVDPLLAGILASFILASGNLIVMGRPNINLLTQPTLFSNAFLQSELAGWCLVAIVSSIFCLIAFALISSRFGLTLRALGDNPTLLKRLGNNIERYRMAGFALTNMLASASGCLTAQTIGYSDIGMGFGMTLTGIGAIILGQQITYFFIKKNNARLSREFFSCIFGVLFYFFAINFLLRLEIDPIYLKMVLGILLIIFLRTAVQSKMVKPIS